MMNTKDTIKKNDVITLTIQDVTIEGDGIGKYNDAVIFVPRTAIGDVLKVKIIKEAKNYFVGKIQEILLPFHDRISPDCNNYKNCGGCVFRHLSYDAELKIKEKHIKDCLERIGHFKNVPLQKINKAKKLNSYRNKAQIPLGYNKSGNLISGFYSPRSHNIVECSRCLLHPEKFDKIVDLIKFWMKKYNISAYNEASHTGLIRHIYIRTANENKEIMVCLVVTTSNIAYLDKLINILTSNIPNISGILLNLNKEKTNVILGKKFITIFGKDYIIDTLCGLNFKISPESFYQINHDQTELLYTIAKNIANAEKSQHVGDLYCGIGTIGMSISNKQTYITGIEIVPQAIKNAIENAKINKFQHTKFICADSSNSMQAILEGSLIVIDPPRKGCSDNMIDNLLKSSASKIIYISCNPATLAKNLKKLCENNNYTLQSIIPVDMFPRTAHVETIALLSK